MAESGAGARNRDPVLEIGGGEALALRLRRLAVLQTELEAHARVAVDALGADPLKTIGDLRTALAFLSVAPLPAELDRRALTGPYWSDLPALRRLCAAGRAHAAAKAEAARHCTADGREIDYGAIRTALIAKGKSPLRFLDRSYGARLALLRARLKHPLPRTYAERLRLVDGMMAAQAARTAFERLEHLGVTFGALWKGETSDWGRLESIIAWRQAHAGLPDSVWRTLAEGAPLTTIEAAGARLAQSLPALKAQLSDLITDLGLDLRRAFGVASLSALPLAGLADRLAEAA